MVGGRPQLEVLGAIDGPAGFESRHLHFDFGDFRRLRTPNCQRSRKKCFRDVRIAPTRTEILRPHPVRRRAVGDEASIVVTCTATVNPQSSASRVINFTASPQGQVSRALIAAQVTFNDFSSAFNKSDCLASTPSPTTCGSGMTVNSWVINPAGG
jgi:hypothetical protein